MADEVSDVVPKTMTVELENGETLTLHEPNMRDWRDGERLLKKPAIRWFDDPSMEVLGTVWWLVARKHGLTREQRISGNWAMSEDALLDMISPADFKKYMADVTEFFTRGFGDSADPDASSSKPSESESTGK